MLVVIIVWKGINFYLTKKCNSDFSSEKSIPILSDEPINSQQEDRLNRESFVESLKNTIVGLATEQSVRICVDAEWGEGKTSIFNLLKRKLELQENQENIKYINFNPWYYNNEEVGFKGLLKLLGHTISDQYPYPKVNSYVDELAKVILGSICNKFLGISFELWFREDKDIQKSLKAISECVKKTGKKYVIFIDDLDRLDTSAIKNVLKIIMVLSEIKNLVFVIAASIENICGNGETVSKEYIEKIVNCYGLTSVA